MEHKRRNIDKLATLDAAQRMYFILAALAIRQSLFPSSIIAGVGDAFRNWGVVAKWSMIIGFLVTVIRFSHGISLLHGSVKASVEQSQLPTAGKVALISAFLVSLGVTLLIIGDNITSFGIYVGGFVFLLSVDFVLIQRMLRVPLSQIDFEKRKARDRRTKAWPFGLLFTPFRRNVKVTQVKKDREETYFLGAAVQWLSSDVLLSVVCVIFIIWEAFATHYVPTGLASLRPFRFLSFGITLIAFAVWDYTSNRRYYFGGNIGSDKPMTFALVHQLGFTPDPQLTNFKSKIGALEDYCERLMKESNPRIAPFAPQAFYPHFLNYNLPEECALGRSCAIAFLKACQEVSVLNDESRTFDKEPRDREISIAYLEGLLVKEVAATGSGPSDWQPYDGKEGQDYTTDHLYREDLKRVYVCTHFREYLEPHAKCEFNPTRMGQNTQDTLWICRRLIINESIAPIAPQAFYPYFWKFVKNPEMEFDTWFKCSIAILQICDAVYIYTQYEDGCPKLSDGMKEIEFSAGLLGLEVQYRTYPNDIPPYWNPDPPRFDTSE